LITRADPTNAIVPTALTFLRGASATALRMNAYDGEQGGYIGFAMLGVLVFTLVYRRTVVLRVVALTGLFTFVFSLGPTLTVQRHDLHVWLPWQLLGNVPLLSLAEPVRLQIFVDLCIAMMVALWIDRVWEFPRLRSRIGGTVLTSLRPPQVVTKRPCEQGLFFASYRRECVEVVID